MFCRNTQEVNTDMVKAAMYFEQTSHEEVSERAELHVKCRALHLSRMSAPTLAPGYAWS